MTLRSVSLFHVSTAQGDALMARDRLVAAVRDARERGATWAEIGKAAGITEAGARGIVRRAERETDR